MLYLEVLSFNSTMMMGRICLYGKGKYPPEGTFFVIILALALLPFKSKTMEGTISYNPQRVLRQLGYDQGAIMITTEMGNSNTSNAES